MDSVKIVDYDPRWPVQFAQIAERVNNVFASGHLLSVEHVGSTSIVGLASKPVIDITRVLS